MAINKEKLLDKLLAMGCSSADLKQIRQMLDDDDAEDDLDETLPLEAGKPRDLKAEDMRTTDPVRRVAAYVRAQEITRPHVGRTLHANDAAGVLRQAIGLLGFGQVDNSLPKEALPELWKLSVRQANAARHGTASYRGGTAKFAMDAKAQKSFNERFPDVARIRTDTFGER